MYATICVAIGAFIIAKAYSVVFGCVLDTLFVCCARDKSDYAGAHMPANLRKAFGFDKKEKPKKEGYEDQPEAENLVAE